MERVSILIPVLRETDLLEGLLKRISSDPYQNKEIIVTIDEPTKSSLKLSQRFKKNVKFIFNKKRIGKVNALNAAAKRAHGDILLFLDSDIIIPSKSKRFIGKVAEQIKDVDILDIKKKIIQDSFLSKIVKYDYITGNIVSLLFSSQRSAFWLCGAAFAMKKKSFEEIGGFKPVITEDLELALDSYMKDMKFKMAKNIEIYTKSSSTWRGWLEQRRRWAFGTGRHVIQRHKDYSEIPKRTPRLFLSVLLYFFWPTLTLLLALPLLDTIFGKTITVMFMLLQLLNFSGAIPFFVISLTTAMVFKNVLLFVAMYALSALVFYVLSKKLGFRFNPLEYLIYYYFYLPVFSTMYFYNFLMGLVNSKRFSFDWKV